MILGALAAILVFCVAGVLFRGLFSHAGKRESTTAETTAFDPNIIHEDLYLDYSAFSPNAELLNMKGMTKEQVEDTLKKSYSWGLVVKNSNPNLKSFTMPALPSETTTAASAGETGADNEGTEEVVKVKDSLSGITIQPDKTQFLVPDLIEENISSFVAQIFEDYTKKNEESSSESSTEETKKAKKKKKGSTEESSESSSAPSADYVLQLPDFSARITDYMNQLALVWNMAPENGDIVSYDANSGEFVFGGTVDGYSVNAQSTAAKLMDAIERKAFSEAVDADGETVPASLSSIKDKYKIIGSYTTKTTANAVRNKNIKLAAQTVNGTIVKPGQEFSFNGTVGQRTEEKGYGGAPAYNAGEVVEEVGGGICQVSTTLYNAVFRSGLTTTYRRSHTFAPNYVTPGMDATVSWPGPDYRFVNGSRHAIGIRASYSDQKVTVQVYGIPVLPDGVSWELTSEKLKDLPVPNPQIITPDQGSESKGTAGSEWQAYKIITKDGKTEKVKDHSVTYKGHPPKQYAGSAAKASSGSQSASESPSSSESSASEKTSQQDDKESKKQTQQGEKESKESKEGKETKSESKAETKSDNKGTVGPGSDIISNDGPTVGSSSSDSIISDGPPA